MVIRVLPASKGGIYSNAGSSHFLVNYLEHEAREQKQEDKAIFFDQKVAGVEGEEVRSRIDANGQGLQKGKPHFHSLVISPSQDELQHLQNDPEKLKIYTRQVMENYAVNFTHKRQKPLTSDNLVWYATIHNSRQYSGLDDAVQTGQAQARQPKEGEQTHVHVIVSARDRSMSRSLHPDAGSSRFNYKAWLLKNNQDFERTFNYKAVVTEIQHRQRLEKQLNRLDRGGLSLDREKIIGIGQQHGYSPNFWKGMSQVERGVKNGSVFTANQAYERLNNTTKAKSKNTKQQTGNELVITQHKPDRNSLPLRVESHDAAKGERLKPGVAQTSTADSGKIESKKLAVQVAAAADKSKTGQKEQSRPNRTDLSPLLNALKFESVPETGEQARTQDDYRRRLKRRR